VLRVSKNKSVSSPDGQVSGMPHRPSPWGDASQPAPPERLCIPPATAIEEGRDLSSMSGVLAGSCCRQLST
jgi:hypothetical protein